ncbi:hypothetical protein LCGC14_2753420, partial [marine sediment metagenome]
MRKVIITILLLMLWSTVHAVDLTGKIEPVNDSFDVMVDARRIGAGSFANYSLAYIVYGAGTNGGNIFQPIAIGTVN